MIDKHKDIKVKMKDRRDAARPRLQTVNLALNELLETALSCIESEKSQEYINERWEEILNKYDINYNNLNRCSEV